MLYRGYDRAGLDAQYNNRARFPDYVEHFARWRDWSEAARRDLPCRLDLAYGPDPAQRLDIFPADTDGAPLCVVIHGGYWYSLDKADYAYVAAALRPHGIATAIINHGLAPAHDMDTIVRHTREALAWLHRHAREHGADPRKIHVWGHSAGGHLGLMLLATDWPGFGADLPPDLIRSVCAIGGIFDLEPISLCFLNDKLHLTPEQAVRNSPLRQAYPAGAPLLLVVATDESPEFHRQSEDMRDLWRALGHSVELVVPPDLDHFSIVNQLRDPGCDLARRQLKLMGPD